MSLAMGRFFLLIWVVIIVGKMHGYRCCIQKERKGLLELKNFLHENSSFGNNRLDSWSNDAGSDCCSWKRVLCDNTSKRVIRLDLSFADSQMSFRSLNLYLLYPFEEIQSLDLSYNRFDGFLDNVGGHKSLGRFRKLEVLNLSHNQFNKSIFLYLKDAVYLKTLILSGNSMNVTFPTEEIKNLRNLKLLDLNWNNFGGSLDKLADLPELEALDISYNRFTGTLEERGICKMKNLKELGLSSNEFSGQLPLCLGSLTKLRVLDLSSNLLSGKVPFSISNLESLEYLSLFDNNLEGLFSFDLIANLSKLRVFKLISRSNQLHVETKTSLQPKFQLNVLELPNCNLEEIPRFLMHQRDLRLIDLSNNRLSGAFPSWLLENNQNLEVLLLQNNSFNKLLPLPRLTVHSLKVLDASSNCIVDQISEDFGQILQNIKHLRLSNNRFQGNFPSSFGEMKKLSFLDLSHNNLSGSLPRSFLKGCYSLEILKLSHNRFSGGLFTESTNLASLWGLSVDSNLFMGKIGDGLMNLNRLAVLNISNNYLTGNIPSWVGNLSQLFLLSISNNFLEGAIPTSLFSMPGLGFLDLSENMLSGSLPQRFNPTVFENLVVHLNSNYLTGAIPDTLLGNLSVLDLRNNNLSGNIPHFVDTQNINALLLRGNHLTGHIPKKLCELSNIMLLDIAENSLVGSIPPCLSNFSGMRGNHEIHYFSLGMSFFFDFKDESPYKSLITIEKSTQGSEIDVMIEVDFVTKQRYDSYTGGPLGFMFGLDLSNNGLSGEIPKELGDLQKVRVLNLSHNSLSGLIPESFSNLTDIESIDLSFNKLYGRIPPQMTILDSLVIFNVSYNNLSGVIPQEKQFGTLDESNYLGNPLLCGPPTDKSCDANGSEEQGHAREDDETAIDMEVFYWSLSATYASVLMGFLVFTCFDSPWRRAWFGIIDSFIYTVKNMWF